MKARIVPSLGSLTLLLVAILLLVPPGWVGAQDAVIPAFVVKDTNGDVVGPFVGFSEGVGASPIIAYDDNTGGGRRTLLTFKSNKGFIAEQGQLFYQNMNCLGQAYLFPPATSGGIQALTGIAYGVGLDKDVGLGGDIWLYRSDSASASSATVNSNYQTTGTPDFTDAAKCVNFMFTSDFVTATKKINVSSEFPQPYTVP